jgi:hypothetical protein
MLRIYDAAFATATGTNHQHLETFWWVDDSTGNRGQWSRAQAYAFVKDHTIGTVYVAEGNLRVNVRAYYNDAGTQWIQTEADGQLKDNLTTLAQRHRQGLPNN